MSGKKNRTGVAYPLVLLMMTMLMVSPAVAACAVVFSPLSGAADCNTGNMSWTATGCPNNMNGTLYVGGSAVTVNSCSVGTDTGAGFKASAGGAATCISTVSTSQALGATTHAVVDGDGGAGNVSYSYTYNYCAKYGTTDVGEGTIDILAGLFDGLAGMMKVAAIAMMGTLLVGIIVLAIMKMRGMAK